MSDIPVSAPAAPMSAPAPAPMQAEVPVNQSPVHSPTPVGGQAPDKPSGVETAKNSQHARREAIKDAFDRAKTAAAEGVKPQPRQRPQQDAEGAPERPPRHREGGRFARAPEAGQAPQQQPGQPGQPGRPVQSPHVPLPHGAPFRDPPVRLPDQAHADWHGVPESVRGAVHQMTREFQGAYQRYRADSEEMNNIRPFHQLAQQHGTTLQQALGNYVGIEQKLRSDPISGLETIVQNLRLPRSDGQPATLRDLAWHILNMSPGDHQMHMAQQRQGMSDYRMGQLYQAVQQQGQALGQMVYQQRFMATRGQVDRFADTHPRFDEVADLVKMELDRGSDLEDAYQRACLLRPTTHAAQTRHGTPAQTRRTSISGAPDSGGGAALSNGRGADGTNQPYPTRRQSLMRAMRRVQGGV